jgi:hypothetical protein
VNQEGGPGDADDMHGRARFNQARAQVGGIRRFADDQNRGVSEILAWWVPLGRDAVAFRRSEHEARSPIDSHPSERSR